MLKRNDQYPEITEEILAATAVDSTEASSDEEVVDGINQDADANTNTTAQEELGYAFDGNNYKLNYKGQEVVPKDHAQLVSMAQKGYSYETSMAELNRQKAEMSKTQETYSKYADLDQYLLDNPTVAEQLINNLQNPQQEESETETPTYQRDPALLKRLATLENQNKTRETQTANNDLQIELNELKTKYPNHNWNVDDGSGLLATKVMRLAYDNGIENLDQAFKILNYDSLAQNTKVDTLKREKERKQKQFKQGIVSSKAGGTAPVMKKSAVDTKMSYNQIAEMALKEYA